MLRSSKMISALLFLAFANCGAGAFASNFSGTRSQAPQAQQVQISREAIDLRKKRNQVKFKTIETSQGINIPNLPGYPSMSNKKACKFLRCLQYSSLGRGDNCCVQRFMLSDSPEQVRDWYKNALVQYQWVEQEANKTGTQILGRRRKDGATVHIMVAGVFLIR